MRTLDFNKRVTLQKRGSVSGSSAQGVLSSKTVWGRAEDTSLSFKADMERAGLAPALVVHVYRHEFEKDSFNYCVVSGTAYRISRTGTSDNDLCVSCCLNFFACSIIILAASTRS